MMANKRNSSADWHLWCRLCANEDPQGNVNIYEKEHQQNEINFSYPKVAEFSLAATIEKYFSVKITKDGMLPKMICTECFSKISILVNFEKHVSRIQQLFHVLLNAPIGSNLDLHVMRLNYQEEDHEQALRVVPSNGTKAEKNVKNEMPTKDPLELEIEIKMENESFTEQYPYEIEQKFLKLEVEAEEHSPNAASKLTTQKTNQISSDLKMEEVFYKRKDTSDEQENVTKTIYKCAKCPQKFQRLFAYRKHLQRKHLTCPQCPKVFMTQEHLDQHSQIHLPVEIKKAFSCPHCEKKFTLDLNLKSHIKHIHLNECPYICEECGEPAANMQMLKYHMLKHTDETPFECEFCKKRFKHQRFLKKHMRYHDNIDHICNECGLQLKSAVTLKRHMLVHSNDLNFKCDHCGHGFKRAKALKSHLILHTGLKPYSCDFCRLTFASGPNCRTHKKRSHPEELAAQEAAGAKTFTKNIPKLRTLIATTKTSNDLLPVASKPSGNFANKKTLNLKKGDNQTNTL